MPLSPDEKALAEAAYERIRLWRRYRNGGLAGAGAGLGGSLPSIIRLINDPHASHRTVVFFSICLGLVFGLCVFSAVVTSRQRKRDEELVSFFEHHFPEECSWKQEERILAEAEDIRLKAKAAMLLQHAAR